MLDCAAVSKVNARQTLATALQPQSESNDQCGPRVDCEQALRHHAIHITKQVKITLLLNITQCPWRETVYSIKVGVQVKRTVTDAIRFKFAMSNTRN
eukprot:3853645-Amphidinium_carterae.1